MNRNMIENLLNSAYKDTANWDLLKNRRKIKITNKIEIELVKNKKLKIIFSIENVLSNMQTDSATFEAWALICKRWLHTEIDIVEFEWIEPKFHFLINSKLQNYQRFLYRVKLFNSLFDWFKISDNCVHYLNQLEIDFSGGVKYFVNVPSKSRQIPKTLQKQGALNKFSESSLEYSIVSDIQIKNRLMKLIEIDKLGNQLPIGVFKEKVSNKNKIFTGSKSAVDLYGEREDCFYIFELKKHNNKKLGILSEIFFYSFVINDLIKGNIKYEEKKKSPFNPDNFHSIKSYFLVFQMHPLIDMQLIKMINTAFNDKNIQIEFGVIKIDGNSIENMEFIIED